jgi:predicted permease
MLTLSVEPPGSAYPDARLAQLWPSLLERVQALPGAHSASLSVLTPFSGRDRGRRMDVRGFQPASGEDLRMHLNYISPDYFPTIGTPLYRGRAFTPRDQAGSPGVAILNRTAARFYFGEEDAIGRRVGFATGDGEQQFEIVGVVEDAKHNDLREPAPRFLYLPLAQSKEREGRLTLAVRTDGEPGALVPALTAEIRALDPAILLTDVAAAEHQIGHSILRDRLIARLSSAFGLLGLALAALGLFGVISHGVAQRTREIGVRMALGADSGRVRWDVMREGLWLVGIGVALGLVVSLVALRAVDGLLYGVRPTDPMTAAVCVLILLSVAAVAAFLPARRASQTDPMVALRSD